MSEELSLAGVLRCVKTSLELSVIDQAKYGPLLITTFSNLAELLLKGFLISNKIKTTIPNNLSNDQKKAASKIIKEEYVRKYFPIIVENDLPAVLNFNKKDEFLEVCDDIKDLREEYRNEYSHAFYSYRADIPIEIIRLTVERFVRFLEILALNWDELNQIILDRKDLKILTYYCSFEKRSSEQRWRKFNERLQNDTHLFGEYLGEGFDGIRRLLALFELSIINDGEFCQRIIGYNSQLVSLILPLMQLDRGLTARQVQIKLRSVGQQIDLQKVTLILDDLNSSGKLQKLIDNFQFVYLL